MVRFREPLSKSLREHPHARQTVISRNSVTPWLALAGQIGHLARDQLGPVHAGLHPRLGAIGEQGSIAVIERLILTVTGHRLALAGALAVRGILTWKAALGTPST